MLLFVKKHFNFFSLKKMVLQHIHICWLLNSIKKGFSFFLLFLFCGFFVVSVVLWLFFCCFCCFVVVFLLFLLFCGFFSCFLLFCGCFSVVSVVLWLFFCCFCCFCLVLKVSQSLSPLVSIYFKSVGSNCSSGNCSSKFNS